MVNQNQKRLTIPHIVALVLIIELLYVLSARTTVYFYDANKPVLRRAALIAECSLPQPVFNAWKNGLVTILKPELPRNCQKLFNGDPLEIRKQKGYVARWRSKFSDRDLLQATSKCSWVKEYFTNNLYTTKLEQSFPIAFTFLIHNSPQQVVRLLKLLYRPHNQYSIAPDLKSPPEFIATFRNIANCLDNVHIVSKLQEVQWGHRSILEAQMQMYRDLLQIREKQAKHLKWKYVINLCGKELPLNSNHDIVSHLVKLNGTSAVNARKIRFSDHVNYDRLHKRIPYGLSFYKSINYMSVSFQFVNFLLANSTSVHLFEFFRENCDIPEEHYYATVYMLPNVPGGYNHDMSKSYIFVTSNNFWRLHHHIIKNSWQCSGRIVHNICVVNVGDIHRILTSTNAGGKALFHNKYFMEIDHVVMDCMEETIIAKNTLEYENDNSCN